MFILDSSVTVAWFVPPEETAETRSLLDRAVIEGAVVPELWWFEVGNALLVSVRRRRITLAHRDRALAQLRNLQLTADDEALDRAWNSTLGLADRFQLTLYDACYLELAERRGLPLATLDKNLRAAGAALGLTLLGA